MYRIAIFGGTFDPIHQGHLQTSLAIQKEFKFDLYCFLPCKTPTLKPPTFASTSQRIEMLKLVINRVENGMVDLREVNRDTPSYMVDTLKSVREENKEASITLILGRDAFLSLPQWHKWKQLIHLANILVIHRQDATLENIPKSIQTLLASHKRTDKTTLLTQSAGNIYEFDAGNYDFSSTEIRNLLKNRADVSEKMPKEVLQYIKTEGLYQ